MRTSASAIPTAKWRGAFASRSSAATAGEYQWGHKLQPAYYAQHVYSALDPGQDVQTYLEQRASRDVLRQDVLDLAGSFLFQGDDVKKPISVLSGGERARVCLAGILLSKRPVLLLDEPTSHLDVRSQSVIEGVLRKTNKTILLATHNLPFALRVTHRALHLRDGRVTSSMPEIDSTGLSGACEPPISVCTQPGSIAIWVMPSRRSG